MKASLIDQQKLEALRRFCDHLLQHPKAITNMQLAKTAGFNHQQLSAALFILYGMHLSSFMYVLKMRRAVVLITNSNDKLENIAKQLGYSRLSHFSQAFKKYYQQPPSQWKMLRTNTISFEEKIERLSRREVMQLRNEWNNSKPPHNENTSGI